MADPPTPESFPNPLSQDPGNRDDSTGTQRTSPSTETEPLLLHIAKAYEVPDSDPDDNRKRALEIKKLERELSYAHMLLQPSLLLPAFVGALGLLVAYVNGWFDVSFKKLEVQKTQLEITKVGLEQSTKELTDQKAVLEQQKKDLSGELQRGEQRLRYVNALFKSGATLGPFNEVIQVEFYNPRKEVGSLIGPIEPPKSLLTILQDVTDESLKNVRDKIGSVIVYQRSIDADDLSKIGAFPSLSRLSLNETTPGDVALTPLAKTKLKFLQLSDMAVTEDSLKTIALIQSLEHVALMKCRLTDAWLKHVGGLKNLQILVLDTVAIQGHGLTALGNLGRLELLSITGKTVTLFPHNERGSDFKSLRDLRLLDTRIGDYRDIGDLKGLQELWLTGSTVDKSLIDALRRLKNLRRLYLSPKLVAQGVIAEIKKDFPAIDVQELQ